MRGTSALQSAFNDTAGIDSRPATLLEKSFHQVDFPVNTLALLQKSLT